VVCGSQRWGQLESRRVGKGCSTMSRGQQWAVVVGSGAPAEIRWHLGAGEHEQRLGKLARGSMGAMGGRWRLSTVASTSPEGRSRAAVVIGVWVGETAEEPGEWVAGVLVVLMRMKDKALGLCSELSTAAARWWPAAVF
jgi:hypothetical protein